MSLAERLRSSLEMTERARLLPGDDVHGVGPQTAAAVLIAVTERPQPGVILTVRRPDMRTHGGQVAFPGGRVDPGESAAEAAVREAWEELGIPPDTVDVAGEMPTYRTVTGFAVAPVLAVIPPDLPLAPHEHEVADWFEAPLSYLLDPINHRRERVLFEGRERHYYRIDWNERNIWGATAAMLVNLSRRLEWS